MNEFKIFLSAFALTAGLVYGWFSICAMGRFWRGVAAFIAGIALAVLIGGCSSTTLYTPEGKPLVKIGADTSAISYRGHGIRFEAVNLNHSRPILAHGEASARILGATSGVITATGAALAGSGLVKAAK